MPSVNDDINQKLQHEATQKVQEKAFDVSSDIISASAEHHKSIYFSMINPNEKGLEFKEYFQEGERRELFGDIAREMQGRPPIKPFDPNFIGPPEPQDESVYERYDQLMEKAQKKIDKLEDKRTANKQRFQESREETGRRFKEVPHKKGRLTFEKGETRIDENGREIKTFGRLKFKDKGRMTEREYYHMLHKKDVADRHSARRSDKAKERAKELFDDDSIAEDEDVEAFSRRLKTVKKGSRLVVQQNVKRIRQTSNHYTRLKTDVAKADARLAKEYGLRWQQNFEYNKALKKSGSSQEMRKKLKKEIARRKIAEQGNLAFRMKSFMFRLKKKSAVHVMNVRRNLTLLVSIGSIVSIIAFFLVAGFILLFLVFNMGTDIMMNTVTSNTYNDISDATAEFRRLETDLEEFLNPEELEPLLQEENPDKEIYEYIYDLDEFGFSANTLISYLSVKFQEFNLQEVKDEIQVIFDEMYYFHYELVQEPRYLKVGEHYDEEQEKMVDDYAWVDVWICYVFLEKTEMETVVEGKMNAEELEQYNAYKLSIGGQQVYGGVMVEDWSNLISSPFGERIHPITGERTFHNGVDIAIPTGTSLYTPVEGVVTTAKYSDTAGNYFIVTTEEGWSVKFMHMDSLAVSAGDVIQKGDFVGYSGNTGRSTGPHLHLEVRNPEDLPIDPTFIVPQSVGKQTN